jgi:hypothetical protein
MSSYVPKEIRERVRDDAAGLCGYCRTHEDLIGLAHEVEHVIPRSRGGETVRENLWLACRRCNSFKAERDRGIDPVSGEEVSLFHPRQHVWGTHFAWQDGGLRIVGRTSIGRATESALKLNLPLVVAARSVWILSGRFPP